LAHRRGQEHVDEFGAALLRSFHGFVMLDDRDVREITKKSLRAQIAIVFRIRAFFHNRPGENIGMAGLMTEEEIIEAHTVRSRRVHPTDAGRLWQRRSVSGEDT